MARKKSKRPVPEHIKAAADRAESRSKGKTAKPKKPKAAINPEVIKAAKIVEEVKARKKGGRPTLYTADHPRQAMQLCQLGATDAELARFFGISTVTLYRWKAKYPEFCNAIKVGAAPADDRVERSLYHRAVGYTYDAIKIMQNKGDVVTHRYKEHVPPDTTAMIFWLKNRQPERWRDVHRSEITGKDGGAIEIEDAGDTDRARRLALIMAKAAKTGAEVTH